ncbi:hypothetical protein IV203_004293 [Nitzschia inconspicua]|uniref:Uncharacterized protein n=1 Tax=Nitzschia inconspicua TaxID=303405 RepID=A0A9K3L423_9STRA|nr:hypothetical protein IV203_004293 [Nitzschia inconspicua]
MAIQMPQKDEIERRSSTGDASTTGPSRPDSSSRGRTRIKSSVRVLGLAMIVEERGSGARLVARYPTHPSLEETQMSHSSTLVDRNESESSGGANTKHVATDSHHRDDDENTDDNETSHTNDLFFTLTARQMAKLFRTKNSLCNQPMTLRVNRTVFCCYAVLMDMDENASPMLESGSTHAANSNSDSELTHFSIVVALSTQEGEASVPFSNFWDGNNEDQMDLERYVHHVETAAANVTDNKKEEKKKKKKSASRVSTAFLAIRRVHISLARLCRALEREEHRCRYVSLQASAFFKIRNEQQKRWEEIVMSTSRTGRAGKQTTANSGSVLSTGNADSHPRKGRHVRQNSFGAAAGGGTTLDDAMNKLSAPPSVKQEQEKEQETLELMLSLPPPERQPGLPKHHGNLVRELCSVYHALSRKDYEYTPTPASLLCEDDSVVYINQHLAIPIEAAGLDGPHLSASTEKGQSVQPYHTLLFPHASPSELLQTFLSSGSAAPQRMEQLLLTVNPQKPLTEIALEADLPLNVALEIASFLVLRHICVTSHVVSLQSRLACLATDRIPDLLLDFSQTFPGINLIGVTSFLTNSTSLGHAMKIVTDNENEDGLWIREMLLSSPSYQNRQRKSDAGNAFYRARTPSPFSHNVDTANKILPLNSYDQYSSQHPHASTQAVPVPVIPEQSLLRHNQWMKGLEEILFSIAVWLLSRRVITHMQDYIVVVDAIQQESERNVTSSDPDELLFKELVELGYLEGDLSVTALSWRLGMDPTKLKAWGLRHKCISVLTRVPKSVDDDGWQRLSLASSLKSS